MIGADEVSRVLVAKESIDSRVTELADQISRDYQEVERVLVVSILRGAFIFTADLTRRLAIPHIVDFMAVTSYGKSTSSGEVRIVSDLRESIEDEHVLIIEDIVDSGNTIGYLRRIFDGRNPASVKTCVMVVKQRPGMDMSVDYVGFEIPDVWVVGYGLDYEDRLRTLPYIGELRQDIYK